MGRDTLFGHLAHRFVVQRENLATEGLCYILQRSSAATSELLRMVSDAGASLPSELTFRTQAAGEDGGIPDIVGEDQQGRPVLIGEAKFWAGLTDAQPVKYVRRLEHVGGGVVLVLAPQRRLQLLWEELVTRCQEAGITAVSTKRETDHVLSTTIDPGGHLVMVSWAHVLSRIGNAMEAAGDNRLVADIVQLQGLCEQMDSEAFFPLASEELTGPLGRRVIQFNQLVDDAFALLRQEGIADGSGTRSAAGAGWYGRYCRIHGVPALLNSNMWLWGTHAHTPIWLRLMRPDWKGRSPEVGRALREAGIACFEWEDGHSIPIPLPIGKTLDGVLGAIVERVREIAGALKGIDDSAIAKVPEPESVPASEEPENFAPAGGDQTT
jgi:hypothetical protein